MKVESLAAVQSLRSTLCPACGGKKKARQTLCFSDYRALPKELRDRLFDRLGSGYEQAVANALEFLEVETPALPS
jgi:hypothetical protein